MKNTLSIKGFKCFVDDEFILPNLTVFTGSNGTGKSSVIQAILLIRLAIERNVISSAGLGFIGEGWRNSSTPLNLGYELLLGTVDDIFNEYLFETENIEKILLSLDSEKFEIPLPKIHKNIDDGSVEDNKSINLRPLQQKFNPNDLPFWRKQELYYLSSERLGPRVVLPMNHTEFLHCGNKGEFTAQVILQNQFFRIESARQFPGSKGEFLPLQIDLWLNSICPGSSVVAAPLGSMNAQILVRNKYVHDHILSTNFGFGISYSLPIIVTGLIAKSGSAFIVENPEAHLHPKGQSNIGFFLGMIAAAGVKVIIETHSEHVINGIRRAVLSSTSFDPDEVCIYFFEGPDSTERIKRIGVKDTGDLTMFPRDFFDQLGQDLAEIFRLKPNQ